MDQFDIPTDIRCTLYDAQGNEITDDDVDFLDSENPLFLAKGKEAFARDSCMALYQKIRPLGEGGFGTVSLYVHKFTGREVAIKFVDLFENCSPADITRVYNEIQHLREIKHPSVVQLQETFQHGSQMCFVMEYCSGGELKEYVKQYGPLDEDEVYQISLQMTEAMRSCHGSKIIHRDLKLENILFADNSHFRIKIVDFGIAGVNRLGAVSEKSTAGSLRYLAPEVLTGKNKEATPELDIWSMGCIIYAMLTSHYPFNGDSHKEFMAKISHNAYKKLSAYKKISKPWNKLMCGMLRTSPRKRWNMLKIIEHLNHYRTNPTAPCDPPSDYSDDEDGRYEESKASVARRHSQIERSPILQKKGEDAPRTPVQRRQTVILDKPVESPSYMQPIGKRSSAKKQPDTKKSEEGENDKTPIERRKTQRLTLPAQGKPRARSREDS